MNNLLQYLPTIIIGVITGFIAGISVQIFRLLVLERQSPFPVVSGGVKPQGAYKYLSGEWFEYHITRNSHQNEGKPYWLADKWQINVNRDGFRVGGELLLPIQKDEILRYPIVGEIRQGRLLITGSSKDAPQDFFTALFPDLIVQGSLDPMVGTMFAFDFQDSFYISPLILHRDGNLTPDRLNKILDEAESPEKPSMNILERPNEIFREAFSKLSVAKDDIKD